MTTQAFELQAVTDEELQAANGGFLPALLKVGKVGARIGVRIGRRAARRQARSAARDALIGGNED